MTRPLLWIPTIDLSLIPPSFRSWQAQRFLNQHRGIGHVISPEPGPWASLEVLAPQEDQAWYCRPPYPRAVGQVCPPFTTLEMPVPQGGDDPALAVLSRIQEVSVIRRLVVRRPATMPLARAEVALTTLEESLEVDIWLDVETFGWDAVCYLTARHPRMQVAGVSDHALGELVRLGTVLSRPVWLADFSSNPPVGLKDVPHYAVPDASAPRRRGALR
ncbi:MAG: hypothetical protein OWU84_09360 [Firmicutes bacterium]|nr:hypothetical protein [Bacillota bacterium]